MQDTGIDLLSFYTPRYYLPLSALAEAREQDAAKYHTGLGQERMGIPPPDEDVVTMAASAAEPLLSRTDPEQIELLIFATETGIDQSKAAGLYVHSLLKLPTRCRVVEMKQACYASTAALRFAAQAVALSGQTALVLASDIARYELGSAGEPTQGSGAIAILVTPNPRLMALDPEAGIYAEDVMDFWRPNYREEALVDGRFSTRMYTLALKNSYEQYVAQSGRTLEDMAQCCYHIPFTNMARTAHLALLGEPRNSHAKDEDIAARVDHGLHYNRMTGNSYTASLYESLASTLDRAPMDLGGQRIGLFAYGSGCVGEYFSGLVQPGYRAHLLTAEHQALLDQRTELDVKQYEDIFRTRVPSSGLPYRFAPYRTGSFRLAGIEKHKRIYEQAA